MPEYGPLNVVEQTAVTENKIVRELASLVQSRASLEEALRRNANEILIREDKQRMMLVRILEGRGVKVAPGAKVTAKTNMDGTVSIVVP